jgi:hypothetical protein
MIRLLLIVQCLSLMLTAATGCVGRDETIAQLAVESSAQQARQSEQVAQASAHLTVGAQHLAESSGRSQESLVALQRELQAEQATIGRQRDALDAERRDLAREQRTAPIIAMALQQLGLWIACLLPLVLAWYVLRGSAVTDSDQALAEVLIEDLVASESATLPRPATSLAPPAIPSPQVDEPAGRLPPPAAYP